MTTFDHILLRVAEVLRDHADALPIIGSILVNRDLNGRVRLVVGEPVRTDATAKQALDAIAHKLQAQLGPHACPAENAVLFEADLDIACAGAPTFPLAILRTVLTVTISRLASITVRTIGGEKLVDVFMAPSSQIRAARHPVRFWRRFGKPRKTPWNAIPTIHSRCITRASSAAFKKPRKFASMKWPRTIPGYERSCRR